MNVPLRVSICVAIVSLFAFTLTTNWSDLNAQAPARMFEDAKPGAKPKDRPVPAARARKARVRLDVLNTPSFSLNLFDNVEHVVKRTKVDRPDADRLLWHGHTDEGGQAIFAVVNGVMTGTVFLDGRSFEITSDPDGDYTIAELDPAAFPTEDPPLDAPDAAADQAGTGQTGAATIAADGLVEIDVMVVWTPGARVATGGTAAIQSVVLAAVANANLAYTNSLVGARLRLVHSSEVAFTETTNIASDLGALRLNGDGKLDVVHSLRQQYGADVVTLLGNGYASAGACGVGYLMGLPSTSFAANAFNVVDRTCAVGYLSYAHEVGHNQGLQHDPGSASGTPSYTYAYGYQDPGGLFRTVLAYGSATRIPFLSSPAVQYLARVTGTSTQDNARALRGTAPVVAAFRATVVNPTCSYTVTPTALSFQAGSGTATVSVTTTSGCSWTSSSGASWATVSGAATGSGTATVAVSANGTTSRSATVVVAGTNVTVGQAAAAPTCTYSVSPTALSFQATAGTAAVAVTTTSGCSWTSSSGTSWASVSGAATGSGTATVSVSANGATSRSATVVVAGKTVTVSQAAAAPACTYTVSPTALSFQGTAGTAAVAVTTTSGCSWTSSSGTSWASVSGAAGGSGTATVSVSANGATSRSTTVVVAGKTVTVSQAAAAAACTYTLSAASLSFTAAASSQSVTVTTSPNCAWTSSSVSWASVSGSGSVSGTATVSVPSNAGAARSTSVVVAGKTVSISQAAAAGPGCTYSVSAISLSFTKAAGSKFVLVTAPSGCSWTSSSSLWATVSGSGSGNGLAVVSVPANTGAARATSVLVAGKNVGVSQAQ